MLTLVSFEDQSAFDKDYNSLGQYDEAKEKKLQMDDFRVEVYKTLEITDLLELQGGPRNH